MGRKRNGLARVFLLVVAVLLGSLTAGRQAWAFDHGTADRKITEDMLKDTPPADYQVDMSIQGEAKDGLYNDYFLKEGLQVVSIDVDVDNLNYLMQNADRKPTVMTNSVTIGDRTLGYVGLKTKGNYTLQHAYTDNAGSDRFSFSLNFGKYIKKKNGYGKTQNFFGCDKISFNNFFFDKSMLKEYMAMKLMTEMGLPTPQYGLAKLYINGGYYGIYFMVESLDSSILEQYKGVSGKEISDYLTKPEESTLEYDRALDKLMTADGNFDLSSVLKMDEKGMYKASGVLGGHAYLWEDDADTLQDVAGMLPVVLGWQRKLSQLGKGRDFDGREIDVNSDRYLELLGQVMDVDEAVRYFAVHSWLVQLDDMFVVKRNFGLYVDGDGRSMILPWDYDLSFGCYYPSMAETTANMNIDLMYKDDGMLYGSMMGGELADPAGGQGNQGADAVPSLNYTEFPLFQVIYQNKSLMERYHQYMKDCSVIAALGGTTSSGDTYGPGRFNSCIEKIQGELLQAAKEKLVKNAYYMNNTEQPKDVERALPNLKRIIALRSLGVLVQVDNLDTVVSGYGCNLETLGNAMQGFCVGSGNLGIVDAATGIYATAEYFGSWDAPAPSLQVREMESAEIAYQEVAVALGVTDADMKVYTMMDTAVPKGGYTLRIPAEGAAVGMDNEAGDVAVYSYTPREGIKKLDVAKQGGTYTVATDSIDYIAVVKNMAAKDGGHGLPPWLVIGGTAILSVVIVFAVVLSFYKRHLCKSIH